VITTQYFEWLVLSTILREVRKMEECKGTLKSLFLGGMDSILHAIQHFIAKGTRNYLIPLPHPAEEDEARL
jgi:hypothetical protein